MWGKGTTPFLTLDNLITLSIKQRGIKYHFLSLWYFWTWDWTSVSRTTGVQILHHIYWMNLVFKGDSVLISSSLPVKESMMFNLQEWCQTCYTLITHRYWWMPATQKRVCFLTRYIIRVGDLSRGWPEGDYTDV